MPTPLAVGLGAACEVAQQEMEVCGGRYLSRIPENNITGPVGS